MTTANHDIAIRRATAADLDALVGLFQGYLAFYRRAHAPDAVRDFLGARLQRGESTVFLAWQGAQAVGFVQLYPAFASLSLLPSWILYDLFVEPAARGRGAARALMDAARQLGVETGACEIFLQTARDNRSAQKLYEDLDYERDDEFLVYTLALPKV